MFRLSRDLWLVDTSVPPSDDLPYGRDVHEHSINLGLEFAFAQGPTRRLFRYEDRFYAAE